MTPKTIPDATFQTRVRNDALPGPNPFEWKTVTSADLFDDQKVVLFGLPGAFTPACSESHLPGFEAAYEDFMALGVDRVICTAVNDAFVMHQWARASGVEKVMMLPDGNGDFARAMGLLVERTAQGMGMRSWRYALYAENREIRQIFVEPGVQDNPAGVPVETSDAGTLLAAMRGD